MKFPDCSKGRHGECDNQVRVDGPGRKKNRYRDTFACECWCHEADRLRDARREASGEVPIPEEDTESEFSTLDEDEESS